MAIPHTSRTFHGHVEQMELAEGLEIREGSFRPSAGIFGTPVTERTLRARFSPHFHPYVHELVERLVEGSVSGLEAADTDYRRDRNGRVETLADGSPRPVLWRQLFTAARYEPTELVASPRPVADLDFSSGGAYSVYNWELFFHIPLTLGIHLSRGGRYEEARRWFHFVFDPTDDSDGPTPERFWKVRPFHTADGRRIEEILVNLSTAADPELYAETLAAIGAWKDAPFRPHGVARYRHSAYMLKTVMAYLDNLIAWGDSLFRQDTGETLNEATQLYVLAANLLGHRPEEVPSKGSVRPQTYAGLRRDLDAFGNALRELETEVPFDLAPFPSEAGSGERMASLRSLGNTLYFCVPRNDRLLGYWDTVADRLFKLRNSLDIRGIFRQLPLFEPPIDPAMLARAAAAGLDIGAVVAGANQPLPRVRFRRLLGRSLELAGMVQGLGRDLLSAMEKEDNEALAILRARHDRELQELGETVRYQAWQEQVKTRESLEVALGTALHRFRHYQKLLGDEERASSLPERDALDQEGLDTQKFQSAEPSVELLDADVSLPPEDAGSEAGDLHLLAKEILELAKLGDAQLFNTLAAAADALGSTLAMIPNFSGNMQPMGAGATISFGGSNLAAFAQLNSGGLRFFAGEATYLANQAAKMAGYERREQDWALQSAAAAGEINQIHKQLRAAEIRESLAHREWKNHQEQIRQAREVETFLTDEREGKTTRKGFYTWLHRETRGLYGRSFQLAYEVAQKAEQAFRHELGDPSATFLGFGYQSGREGLLAGEKLSYDLRRMEQAYDDNREREYELTEHVSLLRLDPAALMALRQTGACTVALPEELFDFGGPGHYFRRIRSVALSLPCVTGPYTGVHCTLSLLKSSVRTSPALADGEYRRDGAEDSRFSDAFGSLQSIVTSSGQGDNGLFQDDPGDDRYLPFEGSGVISEWRLELPDPVRQFDYQTLTDVILHIRYTAREGGGLLRQGASVHLEAQIAAAQAAGSTRLLSVRHELPTAWARFRAAAIDADNPTAPLTVTLEERHYPFWSQGRLGALHGLELYASPGAQPIAVTDGDGNEDTLVRDAALGDLRVGRLVNIPLPAPTGAFTLELDRNDLTDLWLAVRWGE